MKTLPWRSAGLATCLCVWMIGCSTNELEVASRDASAPRAIARDASARIAVEQTGGRVAVSDPVRRARAFENGLVGQRRRPVVVSRASSPVARVDDCPLPPGEPCDPPPPEATLSAATIATDAIQLNYTCGEQPTTLVRTSPVLAELPMDCAAGATNDTGLTPGTTYCYALRNDDGTPATPERCARTLWEPYLFAGPGLGQAESDQMAAAFDWTHTDAVAATITTQHGVVPALYSMNILLQNDEDFLNIRGLGIHTQTQPLLPDEQAAWEGQIVKAMVQDRPAGVWITAIVPGPVYNDLRQQALDGIASGQPIGLEAMVFRRINFPGAAFYPNNTVVPVSPLDPTFLGEQGIEFNGYSAVECDPGPPRTCTVQQAVFGWLVNKLITIAIDILEDVVHGVRQFFGFIQRIVFGEVDVTVQLVLANTDEAFGGDEEVKSGWNAGSPLVLEGLYVRAYQGVAEFTATTDENGVATLTVAKHFDGKVCVDLENDRVTIVDTFTERRVCVGTFSGTTTPMMVTLVTADEYANVLAAMTDAADYLETVMGFDMPRISVLTGWQSSLVTALNGGRSFAPCMGRMPNLVANLAIYGGSVATILIPLLGEIAEFLTSYDVVLAEDDVRSRGVGVHEYGHAAMCELLREADQVKASAAWADVMVASMTGQSAASQQAILAEGFADFLTLQVLGGTNYVSGQRTTASRGVQYCRGDGTIETDCFETNSQRCEGGSSCAFTTNVKWMVSLLQDAFDRIPADAAERANPPVDLPNDGSHWRLDGLKLMPSHASFQVSAADSDTIQLQGPSISNVFSAWAERGSVLRYSSFLGGLAHAMKVDGFDFDAACAMFAAHEPDGVCPGHVIEAYGTRFAYAWADQPGASSYHPHGEYAHNGANDAIAIDRLGTGRYRVTFAGLPAWSPTLSASVALTAYGSSAITCSVANLDSVGISTQVDVLCWDNAAGAAADSRFSILVMGNSAMPSPSAFLSSGGPAPVPAPSPLVSWTSGRHPMTVTHRSVPGDYDVNLGVGNAPLTAKLVTTGGAAGGERCTEGGFISGGLRVRCYDRDGVPADQTFYTVQVAGGRAGQRFGFAFANQSDAASYTPLSTTAFNSSGGPITITRSSAGRYLVNFAGLQKEDGHTENVQVTSIGEGSLVTCNVVEWSNSADGLQVRVECRNGSAQLVNARYEVMVIE